MLKIAKIRLIKILFMLAIIAAGIGIILYNLQENIVFFYSPSDVPLHNENKIIKVGGLVKDNSIKKINYNKIQFVITDNIKEITIHYTGILPALFRQGQGIVASGKLKGDIFLATELLTKHDENYMPPEVANAIKPKQ